MTIDELRKMLAAKSRRKPRRVESDIQRACVTWFRSTYPELLLFAVPNGGSRNSLEAANLKREGAMAGVSDLIAVGNGKVLFVEMKSEKGRQTEYQKEFEKRVTALGHTYVVCRSLAEFAAQVSRWLKN